MKRYCSLRISVRSIPFLPILLFLTLPSLAQESTDSITKRTDTYAWYIGTSAGAQVFSGMNDSELSFGKRISATGGITGGRWLNNWLAVDASVLFSQFRGAFTTPREDKHFTTEEYVPGSHSNVLRYQRGCYTNIDLNARFDLNTIFYGYLPERHSHFLPHVGAGIATGLGSGNGKVVPTFGVGLQYQYAFSPQMAAYADFCNDWFGEHLDNEHCSEHSLHYAYGLKIGFVYTFKNKK